MATDQKEDEIMGENYISHINSFKNNDPDNCPSSDLLLGFHENTLSRKNRKRIGDHLGQCPLCLKALESLTNAENKKEPGNWESVEKEIDKKFYSGLDAAPVPHNPKELSISKKTDLLSIKEVYQKILSKLFLSKKFAYAGAFAGIILVMIYSYAYLSRDKYFSLARIQPEKQMQMRSLDNTSAFTEGLEQFEQQKYDRAIIDFNLHLKSDPNHYASFYYLGLCHLYQAEVKIFGLGYKFDGTKVEKGIENLNKALRLTDGNLYYQADCQWYLGKAYLMMGDVEEARSHFTDIMQLNNDQISRKLDAGEIIKYLQ